MAKLQKTNVVSSDMTNRVVYEGRGVAKWYPNYKNISNWYWSPAIPTGEKFFYYTDTDDDIYVQYGKNQEGWVSAKFFGQTVEIVEENLREDNVIEATVRVKANFFWSQRNNYGSGGVRVKYTIKINGVTQYTFDGSTTSSFEQNARPYQEFFVRVYPRETSTRTSMIMDIVYPDGQFQNRQLVVGFGLFNPNYDPPPPEPEPETYVPMSIRKGGTWRDLNNNNGTIKIRKGSSWVDKSEEFLETSRQANEGQNRIRKGVSWRQLPPMEGGNSV